MSGQQNLSGLRVLVVEDNYLLALDTSSALGRAGAEVVGPVSNESDALAAIGQEKLDAAVADINLGSGPCFKTAAALQASGVPFVFLTGYDVNSVPAEFGHVPCLLKPIDPGQIVRELARLVA